MVNSKTEMFLPSVGVPVSFIPHILKCLLRRPEKANGKLEIERDILKLFGFTFKKMIWKMLSINFSKNEHAHHKGKWFVKRSPLSTNIVGPSVKHLIAAALWIKLRWYECDVLHIAETQSLAWILRFGVLNIFFHLPLQVHFFLPCYKPRGIPSGGSTDTWLPTGSDNGRL